jgi:benzylsuccinate CoA-transferase BbsE subunit/naphthyl-2-methylsuccinate CoA transferase subunit
MDEKSFLSPYRILDLTNEQGFISCKLLGDLGADVIKIEKPGGDPARNISPYYRDIFDPQKSLYWFAFNTSKRGITLDIETSDGQEIFKKLVRTSDCVVESFRPGYLDSIGLGYADLCQVKADIIVTSITPFGSVGPYKDYEASDLTLWALSGLLFICGDPDRPPVRISLPQSYLHAGVDAAVGTVMALYYRGVTGEGQKVEVSIQESMERVGYASRTTWDGRQKILRRPGSSLRMPPLGTITPLIWGCKDGFVAFYLFGGVMGAISNPALVKWMEEESMATDFIKSIDWPNLDIGKTPQEEIDLIVEPISKFFMNHTKSELWEEGVKRRVMVYPAANPQDILCDPQLREREFWVELEHPELNDRITYPGAFVKTEDKLCRVQRRAPLIGEHNVEIYVEELGFSKEEIAILKQCMLI